MGISIRLKIFLRLTLGSCHLEIVERSLHYGRDDGAALDFLLGGIIAFSAII